MNTIYFAAFVAAELILARAPGTPVALVEAVNGNSADVEFMDYVDPGKVIHLNSHDWIVLSYLKSCVRETITGGIVTVGTERSEVESGKVERSVVPCEAGKMLLTTQTASQAAGMVFRSGSGPRPQFTLYGLSPIVELKGGGTLLLERIDRPGERYTVAVDERQLLHGAFYDFANSDRTLAAGAFTKLCSVRSKLSSRSTHNPSLARRQSLAACYGLAQRIDSSLSKQVLRRAGSSTLE